MPAAGVNRLSPIGKTVDNRGHLVTTRSYFVNFVAGLAVILSSFLVMIGFGHGGGPAVLILASRGIFDAFTAVYCSGILLILVGSTAWHPIAIRAAAITGTTTLLILWLVSVVVTEVRMLTLLTSLPFLIASTFRIFYCFYIQPNLVTTKPQERTKGGRNL